MSNQQIPEKDRPADDPIDQKTLNVWNTELNAKRRAFPDGDQLNGPASLLDAELRWISMGLDLVKAREVFGRGCEVFANLERCRSYDEASSYLGETDLGKDAPAACLGRARYAMAAWLKTKSSMGAPYNGRVVASTLRAIISSKAVEETLESWPPWMQRATEFDERWNHPMIHVGSYTYLSFPTWIHTDKKRTCRLVSIDMENNCFPTRKLTGEFHDFSVRVEHVENELGKLAEHEDFLQWDDVSAVPASGNDFARRLFAERPKNRALLPIYVWAFSTHLHPAARRFPVLAVKTSSARAAALVGRFLGGNCFNPLLVDRPRLLGLVPRHRRLTAGTTIVLAREPAAEVFAERIANVVESDDRPGSRRPLAVIGSSQETNRCIDECAGQN